MTSDFGLISVILGLGGVAYLWTSRSHLSGFCGISWLIAGYSLTLIGWLLSACEMVGFQTVVNTLEHMAFAASTLALVIWCDKAGSYLSSH